MIFHCTVPVLCNFKSSQALVQNSIDWHITGLFCTFYFPAQYPRWLGQLVQSAVHSITLHVRCYCPQCRTIAVDGRHLLDRHETSPRHCMHAWLRTTPLTLTDDGLIQRSIIWNSIFSWTHHKFLMLLSTRIQHASSVRRLYKTAL